MRRAVRELLESGVPGCIVGISLPDGETVLKSGGFASVKNGHPMAADVSMPGGSTLKLLLGMAAADVFKRHGIDPGSKATDWIKLPKAYQGVTLQMLGNHTSGLPEPLRNPDFRAEINGAPDRVFTREQILEFTFAQDPVGMPGQGYSYSNANSVLLAWVLEVLESRPWHEILQERVVAPLRLEGVAIPTPREGPPPPLRGYRHGAKEGAIEYGDVFFDASRFHPSWANAGGDYLVSAGALLVLAEAFGGSALLESPFYAHGWTETGTEGFRYGFQTAEWNGSQIGHAGDVPGFSAFVAHDTTSGCTVAVLTNLSNLKDKSNPAQMVGLDLLRRHSERVINGEQASALQVKLDQILQSSDGISAHATVIRDGRTLLSGRFPTQAGSPANGRPLIRAGSISKTFTSLLLARLHEEGKIDIHQTIRGEWLPRWERRALQLPTLAQTLSHTAGLPGSSFRDYAWSEQDLEPSEYLEKRAHSLDPIGAPGDYFLYSNAGHTLAAAIAVERTGIPFDVLMQENVLDPLGLRDSSFRWPGLDRMALGSIKSDEIWHPPFRPSGSLVSTTGDLAQFMLFLARSQQGDGPLAKAARLILAPASEDDLPSDYRLGIFPVYSGNGTAFLGHGGAIDGYRTWAAFREDSSDCFAIAVFPPDNRVRYEMRDAIMEFLAAGATRKPPVPPAGRDSNTPQLNLPSHLAPLTSDNPAFRWIERFLGAVKTTGTADGLRLDPVLPFLPATVLESLGDGRYRESPVPVATHQWRLDHDGIWYLDAWQPLVQISRFRVWAGLTVVAGGVLSGLAAAVCCTVLALGAWSAGRNKQRCAVWLLGATGGACLLALPVTTLLWGGFAPIHELEPLGRVSAKSLALLAVSVLGPASTGAALFMSPHLPARSMRAVICICIPQLLFWTFLAFQQWSPMRTWTF